MDRGSHRGVPPPIDVARLLEATFLQHVEHRRVVESTNDLALELTDRLPAVPALVIAERQTRGRGRATHAWWSGPGCLTFSLVVPRERSAPFGHRWPLVSLVTGLAVAHTLRSLLPSLEVRVKWPNDVFLEARKVCGILVETSTSHPQSLVIGVGLNVNNRMSEAPDELPSTATSLTEAAGRPFALTPLLIDLLNHFESQVSLLEHSERPLSARWRSFCLLENRQIRVQAGNRVFEGRCLGIDEDGALLVRTDAGTDRCYAGTVELLETASQ